MDHFNNSSGISDSNPQGFKVGNTFQNTGKKSKTRVIAAIVIIVMLTCSGTAFAFRGPLSNALSMMTKSPVQYYANLEKQDIKKNADKLSTYLDFTRKNFSCDATTDISYDRDTIDGLLNSTLGTGLKKFEDILGIQMGQIGLHSHAVVKEGRIYEDMKLRLNKSDALGAVLLLDSSKKQYLLQLPELSKDYLNFYSSTSDIAKSSVLSDSPAYTNAIYKVLDSSFITRYADLIIDQIDKVTLSKHAKLKTNSFSEDCNELTATITKKDLNKMAAAILQEAQNDKVILDLLPSLGLNKENFQTFIKKGLEEFTSNVASNDDTCIKMNVYVDNNGSVLGRQFCTQEQGKTQSTLGYTILHKGSNIEFELYLKDASDTPYAKFYGRCTKKGEAYSGNAAAQFAGTGLLSSSINLNAEFENLRAETKGNRYYQYGKIKLSIPLLMGTQIGMDFDVKDDTQYSNIALQMGSSKILSLDTKLTYLDGANDTIPDIPGNEKIYDLKDYQSFIKSFDLNAFSAALSKHFGVDAKKIMEMFQ
jgi:hypothetical protein